MDSGRSSRKGSDPNKKDQLIGIDINTSAFKRVITMMQDEIQDLENKLKSHSGIVKHVTHQYTQVLEDCGYEEGTLRNILANIPKVDNDLIIKNQVQTFCLQLKSIVEEIKDLSSDVENIDNQRKQFDYRLTYLENVSKNIVAQTEYRSDVLNLEERLTAKTALAIDSVLEELNRQKDYVDLKVDEFKEKVNNSEMKTVGKIQD